MASRRTVLTQFLDELSHLHNAVERITPELLTAWHRQANQDHSGGHKPVSYEPSVTSSKEPPAPSVDRDDKHIEAELRRVWDQLRNARVSLDWIGRTTHARTTPTTRMPDPEVKGCVNPNCTTVHTMIGRDRPSDAAGHCARCYVWMKRKGSEWAPRNGVPDPVQDGVATRPNGARLTN